MPKRKFKKCWTQEEVEQEKRWRKARMDSKRQAGEAIRRGLEHWERGGGED